MFLKTLDATFYAMQMQNPDAKKITTHKDLKSKD
jgi:hypothetical protein